MEDKKYAIYFDGENFYVSTKSYGLAYIEDVGLVVKVEDRELHNCEKKDAMSIHILETDKNIKRVTKKKPGILFMRK